MAVFIDFLSLIIIGGIVALVDENRRLFAVNGSIILAIILTIAISGLFETITLESYYISPIAIVTAVFAILSSFVVMPRLDEIISVVIIILISCLVTFVSNSALVTISVEAVIIALMLSGIEKQVSLGSFAILSANLFSEQNGFGIAYLLPVMVIVIVLNVLNHMFKKRNIARNPLKIDINLINFR